MVERKDRFARALFWFAVAMLTLCSLVYFGGKTLIGGFWFVDIDTYWRNTAYAIRGYDLRRVAEDGIIVDSIGRMGAAIIMPWGRLLANLIYPGFLPLRVVRIYYYVILLGSMVMTGWLIHRWMKKEFPSFSNILLTVALVLMPLYWDDALDTGNMGGVLCMFIIMAVFLLDEHPVWASFLLAMACIKPQNVGLFLLVLLIRKKWKILFGTGGFALGGWALSELYVRICGMLREAVIVAHAQEAVPVREVSSEAAQIINGYAGNGQGSSNDFFMYGIFSKMLEHGWNSYQVLIASACLGIVFTCAMLFLLRKTKLSDSMVAAFAVAALGSVFWCYKTPCDEVIMILCNLLVVYYWTASGQKVSDAIWCGVYLAGMNAKIFRFWGRKLFPGLELRAAITCDMILRIVLFIVMIVLLRKLYALVVKSRKEEYNG